MHGKVYIFERGWQIFVITFASISSDVHVNQCPRAQCAPYTLIQTAIRLIIAEHIHTVCIRSAINDLMAYCISVQGAHGGSDLRVRGDR